MLKPKTSNFIKIIAQISGATLVIFSIYTAVVYEFKHFYEFLLLGLLFLFSPILSQGKIIFWQYFRLYIRFFIGGIIGDLIMGLWLTKLWYYSYDFLWEYLLIYFWIYPIAGIVLVQNFIVFKNFFVKDLEENPTGNYSERLKIILKYTISIFCISLLALILKFKNHNFFDIFLYGFLTGLAFLIIEYRRLLSKRQGLINQVWQSPVLYTVIILLITFLQAMLHEIPNIYAKQWVYDSSRIDVFNLPSLPVPILVVFPGWLALVVLPISVFYGSKNFEQAK